MLFKKLYVILKVTKNCNLRCSYCYESKSENITMPIKLLLKCLEEITSFSEDSNIILHGGEPMSTGIAYWKTFFEYGEKIQKNDKKITYNIQSNGMYINKEWIALIKKYNISIGFSLDGHKKVHDKHRLTRNGKGTFEKIISNLDIISRASIEKKCLSVITKDSLSNIDSLYHFFEEQSLKSIDFLPCMIGNPKNGEKIDLTLSPEEYAEFLIKYYDLWKSGNREYTVRTFSDFTKILNKKKPESCHFIYPKICGREVISINTNGDIYPCDTFADVKEMCMGNIFTDGLEKIYSIKKNYDFYEIANTIPKKCETCAYLKYCYGGCLYHRYFCSGKLSEKSFYCYSYKRFFQHLKTH
jgi:uncharacterized protein